MLLKSGTHMYWRNLCKRTFLKSVLLATCLSLLLQKLKKKKLKYGLTFYNKLKLSKRFFSETDDITSINFNLKIELVTIILNQIKHNFIFSQYIPFFLININFLKKNLEIFMHSIPSNICTNSAVTTKSQGHIARGAACSRFSPNRHFSLFLIFPFISCICLEVTIPVLARFGVCILGTGTERGW